MINLSHHFRSDDKSRHSEWLRQRKWFVKAREDRERREHTADKLEDDLNALGTEAIIATEIQIREFEAKLDTYDAATVTALMVNQEHLDAVNAHILSLLDRAYVMEDGRRVFKTEDGKEVFDEDGNAVSRSELGYDLISDENPSWEEYKAHKDRQRELLIEKEEILEYQSKLDESRDRISDEQISEAELDALEDDLLDAMPDAVRSHVAGMEMSAEAPDLKSSFEIPAAKIAKTSEATPVVPTLTQ